MAKGTAVDVDSLIGQILAKEAAEDVDSLIGQI